MNTYREYLQEIEERKGQGLHPKPIEDAELINEIIEQIKDTNTSIEKAPSISLFTTRCQEQQVLQGQRPGS